MDTLQRAVKEGGIMSSNDLKAADKEDLAVASGHFLFAQGKVKMIRTKEKFSYLNLTSAEQ